MPRTTRKKSPSQIYHVMLRGVNKQQIFFDEEDCAYFTGLLKRYKKTCGYQLYAYALMGNHVHLLIREGEHETIGEIVRHVAVAFVYWYNIKYERTGHLFQDRFKSEPVDTDAYLLTVFRYILMNPVKAGLCASAEQYPYSSASEYISGAEGITDTARIQSMLSKEAMREYICRSNEDRCLDADETIRIRVTDEKAEQLIRRELGGMHPTVGKAKERQPLNTSIQRLLQGGISIRQLSRLTGISKKMIENAVK
ncbi:MAG: transposase [Clostridia bacterium]|nr:transposase [Clostridia bacterium]